MEKDARMSTTAITAQNKSPLDLSQTITLINQIERLLGLLKQCNRDIAGRLKV